MTEAGRFYYHPKPLGPKHHSGWRWQHKTCLFFFLLRNADFQWSQWSKSYIVFPTQKDVFGCWRQASCGLLDCSQTRIKNVLHVVVTLHHTALSVHAQDWHRFSWRSNVTVTWGSFYVFLQLSVIDSSQINNLYWLCASQPGAEGLKHIHTHHCHN